MRPSALAVFRIYGRDQALSLTEREGRWEVPAKIRIYELTKKTPKLAIADAVARKRAPAKQHRVRGNLASGSAVSSQHQR